MVQQRQRKDGQAQGQRKAQRGQRVQQLRGQLLLQQLQRRKRQVESTTGWTRKSFQRTTRIWRRKRIQQQRQQPTTRKRAKGKHATNVCYRCGQPGHMANCDNHHRHSYTSIVGTTIPTTPTGTWNRTTAQNSDQPTHQAFLIQMGLRDKPQRTTNCHTDLRV